MSMIPLRFRLINTIRPGTPSLRASRSIPDHGKACFTEMDKLAIFIEWLKHVHFPYGTFSFALTVVSHYRDSRRPLHRQSRQSHPFAPENGLDMLLVRFIPGLTSPPPTAWAPTGKAVGASVPAGTNLYGNRIPSTIPFPRHAPDLTRHYVSLRSMLKCEGNMVCRYSGVLRKDRWDHIGKSFRVRSLVPDPIKGARVAPSTGKAVGASTPASGYPAPRSSLDRGYLLPDSGTPGTTHRHVTGPQVVPQCSLQEQPSVHAIPIFQRFYPSTQSLQTYATLKGSCSCTPMSKSLQKNILTRFFLPDSHNHIGESGLSGHRHGGNVSDVDELRVLADRRPKLHRNSRFAGYPRATTIGKEHPAMAWVVNVGGRTAKQIAGHPLVGHGYFNHAGVRPRKKN